jgi:hypothetical protein
MTQCPRLPIELQELICIYLIGDDDNPNMCAIMAMRVCKNWANIISKRIYR